MADFATFTLMSGQPIYVRVDEVVAVSPIKGASKTELFVGSVEKSNLITVKEDVIVVLQSLRAIDDKR